MPDSKSPLTPAVEFSEVSKRFGSVAANEQIGFSVQAGEIHAIVGENGAGKSTLMGMLSGFVQPDSGHIEVFGNRLLTGSPKQALELGVGLCAQHFHQVPTFTGMENILLGSPASLSFSPLSRSARKDVEDLMARYGLETDLDRPVANLSVGEQERVEILGLLHRKSRVLILDEPTAVLAPSEVERLFEVLRQLASEDRSVLFVTHKLPEVLAVADRVTVLRAGRVVGTLNRREMTEERLVKMIVGGTPPQPSRWEPRVPGATVLELNSLSVDRPGSTLLDISLHAAEGEIVGVGGVEGNGQRELVRALLGYERPTAGTIEFLGQTVHPDRDTEFRHRIGVIPEDRHREGLLMSAGLVENGVLGSHSRRPFADKGRLRWDRMKEHARNLVDAYGVRPSSLDLPAASFSGGNQQRFISGREIARRPPFLVAVHPTRGVDLVATQFLHGRLLEERLRGTAILLITADLSELQTLSDRLYIFYRGRVAYTAPRGSVDSDRMQRALLGLEGSE